MTIFSTLCNSIASIVCEQQTKMVSDYMNNIVHAKSVEVDLEYYENSKYYDALQRAQGEDRKIPLFNLESDKGDVWFNVA